MKSRHGRAKETHKDNQRFGNEDRRGQEWHDRQLKQHVQNHGIVEGTIIRLAVVWGVSNGEKEIRRGK